MEFWSSHICSCAAMTTVPTESCENCTWNIHILKNIVLNLWKTNFFSPSHTDLHSLGLSQLLLSTLTVSTLCSIFNFWKNSFVCNEQDQFTSCFWTIVFQIWETQMRFVCKLAMTSAATLEVRTYMAKYIVCAIYKYIAHTEREFVMLIILNAWKHERHAVR